MDEFFQDLGTHARRLNECTYEFQFKSQKSSGFLQVHCGRERQIIIHRLWADQTGMGIGSLMLKTVCDLADKHGLHITLKALPFGRKPYPMSRSELVAWYMRHGFEGARRELERLPRLGALEDRLA
ncbi:MAG: hypothetical protein M3O30_10360 [Planctomycetota bacterium]|nr:hypothetical protein [Planctomycetota bacterium]